MAWIESHQELKDHPKTKRLARLLGISIPQAIGHLHCLWWWAHDYAEDGDLSRWDAADLADAALWPGDADQFLSALIECGGNGGAGFVDAADDYSGHRLHHWHDYAGRWIEKRAANAERMRRSRASHVPRTIDARSAHVQGLQHTTEQNNTSTTTGAAPENEIENGDEDEARRAVVKTYEEGTARPVTGLDIKSLGRLCVTYGGQLVIESIQEAAAGGHWAGGTKYLQAILERWAVEGRNTPATAAQKRGNGRGTARGNPKTNGKRGGEQDRYEYTRKLQQARGQLDAGDPANAAYTGAGPKRGPPDA